MTTYTFIDTNGGTSSSFLNAKDWSPTGTPGAGDDAILPEVTDVKSDHSNYYTAIVTANETVNSISVGVGAVLQIDTAIHHSTAVNFTALSGTGSGENAGTIDVSDNMGLGEQPSSFEFGGTMDNAGVINLDAPASYSYANIMISNNGTLTGGGIVEGGTVEGATPTSTLTNVDNIIEAAVTSITLINGVKGSLDPSSIGNSTIVNSGTIYGDQATLIGGTTVNNSKGGVIHGGCTFSSSTIIGGTLQNTNEAIIDPDGPTLLDGTTSILSLQGPLEVLDAAALDIQGTIDNTGEISLNSTGDATHLTITAESAALTGTGTVLLGANPNNKITGTLTTADSVSTVSSLANADTIVGVGSIGLDLSLSNTGVIDATGGATSMTKSSRALILATGYAEAKGSTTIANIGVLEATNPSNFAVTGGLLLDGVTVANTAGEGVVEAVGANTHVDLEKAVISGGALTTSDGGVIDTIGTANLLNGNAHAVDNEGVLAIGDGTGLSIEGVIKNTGTISLDAASSTAALTADVGATLTGAGTVSLADNAGNQIAEGPAGGKGAAASLTNINNTIIGAGTISADLISEAAGVVEATGTNALILNSGATAIVNDGLLEANGAGGLTLASAVTGTGSAKIANGALDAQASFAQNVAFTGTSGKLELAQSQSYTGTVSGFSLTGGTSFDLLDIGFVSANEATFVGTSTGGVLTVTDGAHIALIALSGDYLNSTFTASSDGHGGTIVVDPSKPAPTSVPRFVEAMAAAGAHAGGPSLAVSDARPALETPLAKPNCATA